MRRFSLFCLALCTGCALAANPYRPVPTDCPSTPLVRDANGLSSAESDFVKARASKAATALHSWLRKAAPDIQASQDDYPVLALSTSGGGLRSLLTGAGVHQAFDSRDSDVSTSGLYQALTYETGLSGGGWLLGSLASNNWPTISALQSDLWNEAFDRTLANPPHFGNVQISLGLALLAKHTAGYNIGLTDIYGRLLGYQLLNSSSGGLRDVFSDITSLSNFTAHNIPYPIMTALNTPPGSFLPGYRGKQMEFHPYEFGSWDDGISAFTPTEYLGTSLSNGQPVNSSQCITRYDNTGYMLGTTSSIFSALADAGATNAPEIQQLVAALKLLELPTKPKYIYFAQYTNPFYKYSRSSAVQSQKNLNLVDGGDDHPDQGDPIWPLLHRDVDVLFVSANSGDTANNFPSGLEIYNTYRRAQQEGLDRMPEIPEASVFKSQGLSNRSVFFGCDDDDVMTIVYLPNRKISYNSGTSTFDLKYTPSQTEDMIKNGMAIATEDGDDSWGTCLACIIMKKVDNVSLSSDCNSCFKQYCYSSSGSGGSGNNNGGSGNGSGGSGGSGGSNSSGGSGGSGGSGNSGGSGPGSGSTGNSASGNGGNGGGNAATTNGGNLRSLLVLVALTWGLNLLYA